MAVEITPVVGCATCAAPLCPRCLGCRSCPTYALGCVCPPAEMPERAAFLTARHRHAAHVDDCFPCTLEWATDCEDGRAMRAAADAAWESYEGMGR